MTKLVTFKDDVLETETDDSPLRIGFASQIQIKKKQSELKKRMPIRTEEAENKENEQLLETEKSEDCNPETVQ